MVVTQPRSCSVFYSNGTVEVFFPWKVESCSGRKRFVTRGCSFHSDWSALVLILLVHKSISGRGHGETPSGTKQI